MILYKNITKQKEIYRMNSGTIENENKVSFNEWRNFHIKFNKGYVSNVSNYVVKINFPLFTVKSSV